MDLGRAGERAQERPTTSKTSAGSTPLRVAFVGLGWWGRALAEATKRSTDLAVAAGCSKVASETEAFAERFRCPTVHGYERIVHDPSIEAVVLATPHSLHAGQVEAAARAGKHVFVEKPFTLTNADARAAVRACDAAGRVLAVGHNRRLLPQLGLIARALKEGRCGSILHVEANFSTPEALGFAQGHWRTSRAECPGGGMTVLGIHVIDWLHALFGPIKEVSAIFSRRAVATDSDDTAHAQIVFASGLTATLVTLYAAPYVNIFTVHGSEARLTAAADCPETDSVRPRLTLTTRDGATEQIPLPYVDTLRRQLEAWAACCAGAASRPAVTGTEGAQNVAVLEAMVVSAAARGRPVGVAYGETGWCKPALWP